MKTINFVVHSLDSSYTGGVLRVITDLANELVEKKLNIRIISLGPIKKFAFHLNEKIDICSLNIDKCDTRAYSGIKKICWFFIFYKKLKPYMQQNNNIWITSSPPLCYLFSILKRKKNTLINCTHTSSFYQKRLPFFNFISILLLRRSNVVISLTEQDYFYYQSKKIKTILIPNGFKKTNQNSNKKQNKNFIFVGRFSEEKQPIHALNLFFKSGLYRLGYNLNFYGYGELQQSLVEKINDYNISTSVSIFNNITDINEIYRDAFCLLMTSKIEGFGMVLLEAMSYNIPCISYDCPSGPSNIIKNDYNGYLIPANNEELFLQKMTIESVMELHKNDISSSIQKFQISNITKKYIDLFSEIK